MKIVLGKLTDNVREGQILLKIDNTTAIAYVNRIKGVRCPHK